MNTLYFLWNSIVGPFLAIVGGSALMAAMLVILFVISPFCLLVAGMGLSKEQKEQRHEVAFGPKKK
jgi:hypothetical protein